MSPFYERCLTFSWEKAGISSCEDFPACKCNLWMMLFSQYIQELPEIAFGASSLNCTEIPLTESCKYTTAKLWNGWFRLSPYPTDIPSFHFSLTNQPGYTSPGSGFIIFVIPFVQGVTPFENWHRLSPADSTLQKESFSCLSVADVKLLIKHLAFAVLSLRLPFIHCCMMKSTNKPGNRVENWVDKKWKNEFFQVSTSTSSIGQTFQPAW